LPPRAWERGACERWISIRWPFDCARERRTQRPHAQIDVRGGSLPDLLQADSTAADLMVANILAPVLDEMARQGLARAVRPGGVLILAGVLAEQAEALEATCLGHGLERLEQRQAGEWRALVLKSKPPYGS
jgi:ribosomal protein L11 methylase PrmA